MSLTQSQSQPQASIKQLPPWLETAAFVAPLIVHMVLPIIVGCFFAETEPDAQPAYEKLIATMGFQLFWGIGLLLYFRPTYLSHFRFKVSWLALPVGVLGCIAWVAIAGLDIEQNLLSLVGLEPLSRPAVNPFEGYSSSQQVVFLIMRFAILAVLVPLAEEIFLRGWLVRWIHDVDWNPVRISELGSKALLAPCVYGAITHPEIIAAIVWFGAVTWLMVKTKSIWSCVVAHMITNLLLGLYVLQTGSWELW